MASSIYTYYQGKDYPVTSSGFFKPSFLELWIEQMPTDGLPLASLKNYDVFTREWPNLNQEQQAKVLKSVSLAFAKKSYPRLKNDETINIHIVWATSATLTDAQSIDMLTYCLDHFEKIQSKTESTAPGSSHSKMLHFTKSLLQSKPHLAQTIFDKISQHTLFTQGKTYGEEYLIPSDFVEWGMLFKHLSDQSRVNEFTETLAYNALLTGNTIILPKMCKELPHLDVSRVWARAKEDETVLFHALIQNIKTMASKESKPAHVKFYVVQPEPEPWYCPAKAEVALNALLNSMKREMVDQATKKTRNNPKKNSVTPSLAALTLELIPSVYMPNQIEKTSALSSELWAIAGTQANKMDETLGILPLYWSSYTPTQRQTIIDTWETMSTPTSDAKTQLSDKYFQRRQAWLSTVQKLQGPWLKTLVSREDIIKTSPGITKEPVDVQNLLCTRYPEFYALLLSNDTMNALALNSSLSALSIESSIQTPDLLKYWTTQAVWPQCIQTCVYEVLTEPEYIFDLHHKKVQTLHTVLTTKGYDLKSTLTQLEKTYPHENNLALLLEALAPGKGLGLWQAVSTLEDINTSQGLPPSFWKEPFAQEVFHKILDTIHGVEHDAYHVNNDTLAHTLDME